MGENLVHRIVLAACGLAVLVLIGAIVGTSILIHQRLLYWMDGSFFIAVALVGIFCAGGLLVAGLYENAKRR